MKLALLRLLLGGQKMGNEDEIKDEIVGSRGGECSGTVKWVDAG